MVASFRSPVHDDGAAAAAVPAADAIAAALLTGARNENASALIHPHAQLHIRNLEV